MFRLFCSKIAFVSGFFIFDMHVSCSMTKPVFWFLMFIPENKIWSCSLSLNWKCFSVYFFVKALNFCLPAAEAS